MGSLLSSPPVAQALVFECVRWLWSFHRLLVKCLKWRERDKPEPNKVAESD